MISPKALEEFIKTGAAPEKEKSKPIGTGFDMEAYLSMHEFEVIQRKPWQSHPGGLIFEIAECPFNPGHKDGSAAFTLLDGKPGFSCKHNGCMGKTIKDVFALFPVTQAEDDESAATADEKRTQAQILCELASDVQLFHTSQGAGYARFFVTDHYETWALRSSGFRRWLIRAYYLFLDKPPGAQALQDAIGLLEARAQFDGPEADLFVRVAERNGAIYLDLCNDKWEAVEITTRGWKVVDDPPVYFRRSRGMLALPNPASGGSLNLLRALINIGDDDNWLLFVSCLIAACRPRGPYPVLILQGEQGTAKSTTAKFFRRVIDPSSALVRTPPRDERDLLITAANSLVLSYDNLSGLPLWLSDVLCRVATGGGFATRQLYTDSDEAFFDAARPVVLNGIDYLPDRADLAERSVILVLPRIEDTNRRDEAELYAEFESKLPQILGGLCEAVSTALARLPHIKLACKPRMADFALLSVAAAPSYGFSQEAFLSAYMGNRSDAIEETLEADLVAAALSALMDQVLEKDGINIWEGSCKALLAALEEGIDDKTKRSREWPKTPRSLSGRLRRLVTFVRERGIEITFPARGGKGKRSVTIVRTIVQSTATTATSATQRKNDATSERDTGAGLGGGMAHRVAVISPPTQQPPPRLASSKSLNGNEYPMQEAEVAEVAVVCSPVLNGHAAADATSDRTDVCPRCGPVDWQWINRVWCCPNCGEPAPGQSKGIERERIEI